MVILAVVVVGVGDCESPSRVPARTPARTPGSRVVRDWYVLIRSRRIRHEIWRLTYTVDPVIFACLHFRELLIFNEVYNSRIFIFLLEFANLSSSRNSRKLKPREYYQIYSSRIHINRARWMIFVDFSVNFSTKCHEI